MDNKFFIYNVAKILSEKTGKKTSEIETFLKELGLLFSEGITNNNFVKIKGIGSFKVIQVKERESVNVNTGERFMIPSHYKLSFIPENKMKDMINKPFALFETIEAQEDDSGLMNLAGLGTGETGEIGEAEEIGEAGEAGEKNIGLPRFARNEGDGFAEAGVIESIIDHNGTKDFNDHNDFKNINDHNDIEEIEEKPLSPPPIPPIKEKPQTSQPSITIEEKPMHVSPPPSSSSLPPPPLYTHQISKRKERKKKKSKNSSTTILLFVLFFLLFILVAGAVYYFFFYNRLDMLDRTFSTKVSGKPEITAPADTIPSENILNAAQSATDTLAVTPSEVNSTDTTKQEIVVQAAVDPVSAPAGATSPPRQEPAVQPRTNPTPAATTSPQTAAASTSNNNNVLARVRIEPGQRLTLIAERYYGNKVFWVYIYEYNKAKIGRNPNLLRTGMEILVPAKELYGINANSAASVDKATDIQRTILEGI